MHADVIDRPYASLHLGPRRTLEVSRNEGEINMHTDTLQLIDNSARGVGKGGTRMSPNLSVMEVARLARTMTWKWAAVDLFHGGAKAGIIGDPNAPNKEEVLRAFARALANEVPAEYVFGLDMGLTEKDAAIFVDELRDRGAAVGLPRVLGGLPYDELGVTGYGAVGRAAADRLIELGVVITAVSTATGAIVDKDGIDLLRLEALRREFGDSCVTRCGGALDPSAALTTDAQILIPAAHEDTIDKDLATSPDAKLIVEGANMPTTPAALDILNARGVAVVADFIANAGGVFAAAHSMDARYSPFPVDSAGVFAMISTKLRQNTLAVVNEARTRNLTTHAAAQKLAQERVRAALMLRGQIPAGARRRG